MREVVDRRVQHHLILERMLQAQRVADLVRQGFEVGLAEVDEDVAAEVLLPGAGGQVQHEGIVGEGRVVLDRLWPEPEIIEPETDIALAGRNLEQRDAADLGPRL